ncbi:MAG: S1C family serine protease [Acidimicrobiia bacterium]
MRRFALMMAMLLVVAACGDDGATTTTSTAPTTTPDSGGAVTSLQGVRSATVQIVARGTFVDPFEGTQINVPGAGSGFIIDPSGLAVTNNHVVTGAATLDVYVQGHDQPLNARIVGVSECNDLAVIDIAGDGFPYLEWYDGPITTGLRVYAAGYPLGDPEYTLLEGIVSKDRVDGNTPWSSNDAVIEHTAATHGGNSGGPVVSEDGRVVAVHYANNNVGQRFALARDIARPVIDQLSEGTDVESLGINGEAFIVEGFSGIWVFSVKSGSPADVAGVQGGDLVTSLEGLRLGEDGTMGDYCDVLRTRLVDDVLAIDVYRPATDQVLRGQINGRELEEVNLPGQGTGNEDPQPPGTDAYTYSIITDDSGSLQVSVPDQWFDVASGIWNYNGFEAGRFLSASPDLAMWAESWGIPGLFFGASQLLGMSPDEVLDAGRFDDQCDYLGRFEYDDGLYVGVFDSYENCGPEGSLFYVIAAEPPDFSFLVYLQVSVATDADVAALDEIIRTFQVVGDISP